MPSPINLRQLGEYLHRQILAGTSTTATSEVAEIFMPMLIGSLRKQFSNLSDQHLIDSAVDDALVDYFANPTRFDPTRAGLFTYLRLRAKSYLLNALEKQKSHQGTENVVEVDSTEPVYNLEAQEDCDPESAVIECHEKERMMQQLRQILTDPVDLEMAEMMMDGIRDTHDYAKLLGILEESPKEQANIVKRHKDRIKVTIQRKYKRGGDQP